MAHVDIVYIHDPDAHLRDALDQAYPTLEELRTAGVVTSIGVGTNHSATAAEFARNTDIDLVMIAGRYTLLEQDALDDLLPECARRGIGVVAAGVFNSGLLSAPLPSTGARYDYAAAPAAVVERAQRIAAVCERHGTSLPAAALAFPLAHPSVMSVCVGARSAEQVQLNAALMATSLPEALWDELRADGLLRAEAPVPSVS